MNVLEKCAEILVESGYAENYGKTTHINSDELSYYLAPYPEHVSSDDDFEYADPFYCGDDLVKECLSRRQADAIEDWLIENENNLWHESSTMSADTEHQWRLDRIKWCLEQLSEGE